MVKNAEVKNHEKLVGSEIFEKIKEDLNPIQENLAEKKITVDEAKSELKKIDEWLKWANLEQKEGKDIWKAFEKLIKLEEDVDINTLKDEVDGVINLLENITKGDLANLKNEVRAKWMKGRPIEVQEWIEESSNDFESTVSNASEDKNPIARKIGKWMKKLMS